jgi:hypothetical protein
LAESPRIRNAGVQSQRFRRINGEKIRCAACLRCRGDGAGRNIAVEWADGHERVNGRIVRHVLDLVCPKLFDCDFVGFHSRGTQDEPQQRRVRRCSSDDADPVSSEIGDLLEPLWGLLFVFTFAHHSGRRPQHDEVFTQHNDRVRLGRHLQVCPANCKVRFAGTQQRKRFGCSGSGDWRELHGSAFACESFGHRLDHLLVVTSCRADGNPQRRRPQKIIEPAPRSREYQKSKEQDQQQGSAPSPLLSARIAGSHSCHWRRPIAQTKPLRSAKRDRA